MARDETIPGHWTLSNRADRASARIADRHYNRQKIGARQFVPPGRCVVLRSEQSVWVTSWPKTEYVMHRWAGAWVNSLFRNEGQVLSSDLIRQAVAITRWYWPEVPALGMITFVDTTKVRHKRDPGRCYLRAGFKPVGYTEGCLLALQLLPGLMPEAAMPAGAQSSFPYSLPPSGADGGASYVQ